jgi:predicted DNA-binding transcriptional regulator AlpA
MTEITLPARFDAADIQRRLAIGARRLYQLIAERRFPPPDLRVGKTGRRLWDLATVDAWERQHKADTDLAAPGDLA